jgi:predicted ferric reductase
MIHVLLYTLVGLAMYIILADALRNEYIEKYSNQGYTYRTYAIICAILCVLFWPALLAIELVTAIKKLF